MKIVKCEIGDYPKDLFEPMPKVKVVFDDGTVKELFQFYPDEISFESNEFLGLTEDEAYHLKFKKDVNYLRS